MASSSVSVSIHRDNSPSLSPTVIHYQQKYQLPKISHHNYRKVERHHRCQKQQIQKTSHTTNSSFRSHYSNKKSNRIPRRYQRQSSSLWEIHRSSNGRIYYYNIITDQSQWEKPTRDQFLSSSITNKYHIQSKRTSNHHYSKKSNQLNSISDDDFDLIRENKITDHQRKQRRKKDKITKLQEDKTTPTSPPPNEIIHIDLVDPIPTPNISISSIHSPNQSSEDTLKFLPQNESIRIPINQDSSLQPSVSTINAILELDRSHSNSDDITRYYRGELIEHLLNWPSTQVERETMRLSDEQTRIRISRLILLRTELYSLRLRFERNRFQLLKYHYRS